MSAAQMDWLDPRKAFWEGAVIGGVGLGLLLNSLQWHGAVAVLMLPGALSLIASGFGLLLWPGDSRLSQYACWGAALAALVLPILALSGEGLSALFYLFALVGAFVCAGRVSLHQFPRIAGAPPVPAQLKAAAHIGTDEFLMAWFKLLAKPPRGPAVERIAAELEEWEGWLSRKRLRSKLQRLHVSPPDLLKVEGQDRQSFGRGFRHIRFPSQYQPAADMPGAERWLSYTANQTAHAWIMEHSGAARPWLLCIHGYRMGAPLIDLRVFSPEFFHHKLGLNLACMVLPLHGARKRGTVSGEGYLEGDFLDFIHAELQAQWDLRRLLSWLRLVKHAPKIGAYGVSLGGYNTALLAGLDKDLACAVAGIPVTDMAATQWRHFPAAELRLLEQNGVSEERIRQAYAAVSPLSFKPRIRPEHLGIFAGSLDALVWPDQPLALQQHWGGAALNWYEGAHLTFLGQSAVTTTLTQTFTRAGLIAPSGNPISAT